MAASPAMQRYLQGFARADQAWAKPPATRDPRLAWWNDLPWQSDQSLAWTWLCHALPQLTLPQQVGISQSELYHDRVLRGVGGPSVELSEGPPLQQRAALQLFVARHPYISMPVLSTPNRADFEWLVRALAHRAEPIPIEAGVHAQAISGLVHWGLIRTLGPEQRASLILLHESPYGSVPSEQAPGGLDHRQWLRTSAALRLEHELTHLTTKQQLGEMRINLLDELVADAMGHVFALGRFSADLFSRCLRQRWRTYVVDLDHSEAQEVLRLVLTRAQELEPALSAWCGASAVAARAQLLPWLCRLRLDQPICTAAPPPHGKIEEP